MIDKRALDAVHFAAKRHGTPDDVVRAVVSRMLPSIRLVARPLADEPPLGASRIGGCPDLPRGMKWPRRDGEGPYRFVLQISLAEVAAFDVARVLPKAGLLSFFYARNPDEWPGDYAFIVQTEAINLR